ncbi:hypothetical protein PIB30_114282, partial [Stylosanthes scabra]|nr:hypothetical protein [Stylosanthes scabra]
RFGSITQRSRLAVSRGGGGNPLLPRFTQFAMGMNGFVSGNLVGHHSSLGYGFGVFKFLRRLNSSYG